MFHNARNAIIKDCTFTIVNGDNHRYINKSVLDVLYKKAAPGGFHLSDERHDPPKCHEDTRLTLRQELLDQMRIAVVSCIIWLYGAAGAGKSAIAQSLAETCEKHGLLIGTFFFFRAVPWRNNALRLAASLAYQLGRSIPSTLPYIAHYITTHPAIFSSSLKDQIDKLFVQPLRRACEEDQTLKPKARLIILDGLDECGTPDVQRRILDILEKALQATPIPIVVLVASRPELHISSAFVSIDRRASIATFRFGLNDDYDVDNDIRIYLKDKFDEVKRDHPFKKCLPDVWPPPKTIESIVTKSSGQFIYAATIIRHIRHHKCNPYKRLQTALGASKRFTSAVRDSPFKELDALYFQVFSGAEDLVPLLAILFLALNINEHRYPARHPRTIAFRLGLDSDDVEIGISDLASLMVYEGEDKPIRFFHASLRDFLVDEQRSHNLYIGQPVVHTVLSKAYCRVLATVPLTNVLLSTLKHLNLAEPDQELIDLVAKVERNILKSIKVSHFNEGQLEPKWIDRQPVWFSPRFFDCGSAYFSDLVEEVYNLKGDFVDYATFPRKTDDCSCCCVV